MQTRTEYVALAPLRAPGTMVYGYQPGDGVPADAVENWELVVGVDVMPRDTGVIPRPAADSDDRAAWEAYAIGQGRARDEVAAAGLADLKKIPAPADGEPVVELPDPTAPPARPDVDARKADWVAYVIATGADKAWATDRSTTKADLVDYAPKRDGGSVPVGDPVAAHASEMLSGEEPRDG